MSWGATNPMEWRPDEQAAKRGSKQRRPAHNHRRNDPISAMIPRRVALGDQQSERNLIVKGGAFEAARAFRSACHGRTFAPIAIGTLAVQHHELATEALQHDLGGIFLGSILVRVFARLQLAFE